MSEPTKRCCHCKKVKPMDNFRKDKRTLDGFNRRCNVCDNKKGRADYKLRCKSKPDYYRNQHLKTRFGMTLKDFDQMIETQNGVCAICGEPEKTKSVLGVVRRLAVDHDHKTGKIRALLCDRCNRLIGMSEENIAILNKAIRYLRGF